MKITSMDISNKEFKKVIRGYDCDSVDDFLDKIAEDYESIFKENSTLKEKSIAMNEKMEQYKKIETTLQNTLLLAQNAAEQAKVNSQKEAELLLRNANATAEKIIEKAHNDVLKINDDYDTLKQDFVKFRAKFRNFMKTQLETFDSLEQDLTGNYGIGKPMQEEDQKEKSIETPKAKGIESPTAKVISSRIKEEIPEDDSLNEIKNFFVNDVD